MKYLLSSEGKELVRKYQYEFPKRFENELYEYLSISEKDYPIASKMFEQPIMSRQYFNRLLDCFFDHHIFGIIIIMIGN